MPSPPGKLDSRDKARWGWTTATVGGTTLTLSAIGSALATLIVSRWMPEAKPEDAEAVRTLAIAVVMAGSVLAGLTAEWLRLKMTDTRGT